MYTLKDCYKVNTRFHRSVHIELDKSLDGYIVTQAGIKVIERIIDALNKPISTRAWSIIGPYGSGKSAFIIFLKSLVGPGKAPSVIHARNLLKKENKVLHDKLFGPQSKTEYSKKTFCRALVSAGRERLEYSILKGLLNGLNDFYESSTAKPDSLIKNLENSIQRCGNGQTPSNDEIIQLCIDTITNVKESKGAGLILVIDELGKTLETAALDHDHDIFILQKLAELASRRNDPPFLLFTLLHQSFDHYASKLDLEKRNEWSKIQGRFEDIPFVDSSDQVFKLIASAIIPTYDKKIESHIKASTENIFTSYNHIFKDDHQYLSKRSIKLLQQCLPLHPLTSMVLVPLFRGKFSQNNRSLFTFITSTEPFGFVDFLNKKQPHDFPDKYSCYQLHHLYDYLSANLGISLFTHHNGKKWVEIDNALSRTVDEMERKIIKTTGVLNLFSDFAGSSINEAMIAFALNADSEKEQKNIKEAVSSLCRKSVIVFRRYSSSYRVWGGSDIDIEQRVLDAKRDAVSDQSILASLNKYFPLRPKVAKRHLHKTGTVRYFKLRYVADFDLECELKKDFGNEDGQILLILKMDNDKKRTIKELQNTLKQSKKAISSRTLIGVAIESDSLINSFKELLALQIVKKSTPELQGDKIALRELDARLAEMTQIVLKSSEELFFPGEKMSGLKTEWFDIEKGKNNISKRYMSQWISDICDREFKNTPLLKNELINRDKVSSTSSMARRLLIQAILEKSNIERVGIKGFPPEYSMYLSVCRKSGIHKQIDNNTWKISVDEQNLEESWKAIMKFILNYLDDNSFRKVAVTELYSKLKKPPFGIKEGVHPVILTMVLKSYEDDIAMFSHGTFLPDIKTSDLELLTKVPQNYELQLCQIKGIKAAVFDQIIKAFLDKETQKRFNKNPSLLHIVKVFCTFVSSLPQYVKLTSDLSDKAKSVRKFLLEAKEPANLLFRDLPVACGLKSITETIDTDISIAEKFVIELKRCITELQRKEDGLYSKVESILFNAFNIDDSNMESRGIISDRSSMIISVTLDPIFKGFLVRVADDLEYKSWLDSIGTIVTGKPPLNWTDNDLLKYEHEMSLFSSKIKKYETLAVEVGKKSLNINDEIAQISIISNRQKEKSHVFHVKKNQKDQIDKISNFIIERIEGLDINADSDLVLAALSKSTAKIIEKMETKKPMPESSNRND